MAHDRSDVIDLTKVVDDDDIVNIAKKFNRQKHDDEDDKDEDEFFSTDSGMPPNAAVKQRESGPNIGVKISVLLKGHSERRHNALFQNKKDIKEAFNLMEQVGSLTKENGVFVCTLFTKDKRDDEPYAMNFIDRLHFHVSKFTQSRKAQKYHVHLKIHLMPAFWNMIVADEYTVDTGNLKRLIAAFQEPSYVDGKCIPSPWNQLHVDFRTASASVTVHLPDGQAALAPVLTYYSNAFGLDEARYKYVTHINMEQSNIYHTWGNMAHLPYYTDSCLYLLPREIFTAYGVFATILFAKFTQNTSEFAENATEHRFVVDMSDEAYASIVSDVKRRYDSRRFSLMDIRRDDMLDLDNVIARLPPPSMPFAIDPSEILPWTMTPERVEDKRMFLQQVRAIHDLSPKQIKERKLTWKETYDIGTQKKEHVVIRTIVALVPPSRPIDKETGIIAPVKNRVIPMFATHGIDDEDDEDNLVENTQKMKINDNKCTIL